LKKTAATLLIFSSIVGTVNATPLNLPATFKQAIQYHDSGRYNSQIALVTQKAEKWLSTQTGKNNRLKQPKKLAVVFDIDETLLSNYQSMAAYLNAKVPASIALHNGKDYTIKDTKAMQATAIKPTQALYNLAKEDKIAIFIITGTKQENRKYTANKLHQAGYSGWTHLYLKPDAYHQHSAAPYKTSIRKKITEKGYDIILNIGDQYSDLRGGYSEQVFKLPNPYYFVP
jgi:predicted secreted acid phosphatase